MYDGFVAGDQTKYGDYSLIYYYPEDEIKKDECETFTEQWRKEDERNRIDIKRFRFDGKLNPVYMREKNRFVLTGTPMELPPNGKRIYETTVSRTHSASVSYSVRMTQGMTMGAIKGEMEAKFEAKYEFSVTSVTKETKEQTNPSAQYTRVYNSGIYRDVVAMQQQPWRAKWYEYGSFIYAGNDHGAFARWYKVRKQGCYRTAVFDTIIMPKNTEVRLIGEYISTGAQDTAKTKCPNQAMGEDPWAYEKTTMELVDDEEYPFPEEFTVFTQKKSLKPVGGDKVPVCLVLSGRVNDETGELYREVLEPADFKGLWVLEDEIADSDGKPKPLPGWGAGTVVSLQSAADSTWAVKLNEGNEVTMVKVADAVDPAAKWKLETREDGVWTFRNISKPDRCLDFDWPVVKHWECTESWMDQRFHLLLHQDRTFYIQERTNPKQLMNVRDNPITEKSWPFMGDVKEEDTYRWLLVEHSA
ncbi:hypothetical protein GCM10022267_83560 [Lentzea roselyniae]|uniref:Uncharacterized protein n=1 Tax=Lentzea roselyniae TaxID=531940 RepID=A0ABP7CDU3_9PSEU